ncbi:MAG: fructose-6-phosphate aldolase [Deltaproteobacteria bacterium]|jgi:transaldolase|nr:fructose-6-phosphate aldolase [Deltaproteobacteria bacterium]
MKFFLDTANIDEIKRCATFGFLDGVTTNPSLMAREGISDQAERIKEICELSEGPVSAEVLATDTEAMVEEARTLAEIAPNVVVKLPLTMPGLAATRELAEMGVAVNVTLVFSPLQSLLAAKAGAAFVSPFVGRLDDIGQDGMDLVENIVSIYSNYAFETEVIVASIRSPQHVLRAALIGADICTIPFKVIEQLASHPLTDKGLAAFLADHQNAAARKGHSAAH